MFKIVFHACYRRSKALKSLCLLLYTVMPSLNKNSYLILSYLILGYPGAIHYVKLHSSNVSYEMQSAWVTEDDLILKKQTVRFGIPRSHPYSSDLLSLHKC